MASSSLTIELRKLAEWYRAFAEVGHPALRDERLAYAEYLEQWARDYKETAGPNDGTTRPSV